jgi:hypothetical protein
VPIKKQEEVKLSKKWWDKVESILEIADGYDWYVTEPGGCFFYDDEEEEEPIVELLLVGCANARREEMGLDLFNNGDWKEAGRFLGLSEVETMVFMCTSEIEESHLDRRCADPHDYVLPSYERYWDPDLRDLLEARLLEE